MRKHDCWEVEIRVGGEPVLTIGENHLSGRNDIDEYADLIESCAERLLGFIGGVPGHGPSVT